MANSHPAAGIAPDVLRGVRLAGRQPQGIPAAEVDAAQGSDGLWYFRYSWSVPTGGVASPITHSRPSETERRAIERGIEVIRVAVVRLLAQTTDRYTETDRAWARKIEAWCADQLAPQQMGLGL